MLNEKRVVHLVIHYNNDITMDDSREIGLASILVKGKQVR